MNPSPDTSPGAMRTRRIALLTAAPLAALAFVVYAYSGLHTKAGANVEPVSAVAAPFASMQDAPHAAPANVDEAVVPPQHDAELFAYRPHGG